jgi:hypothetical protein
VGFEGDEFHLHGLQCCSLISSLCCMALFFTIRFWGFLLMVVSCHSGWFPLFPWEGLLGVGSLAQPGGLGLGCVCLGSAMEFGGWKAL